MNHAPAKTDTSHAHPQLVRREITPVCRPTVHRFVHQLKNHFGANIDSVTVYGPAVTDIFDERYHQVHFLIVTNSCDVNALFALGKSTEKTGQKGIAPPLILTRSALKASFDVFPLEWLDVHHFHSIVIGEDPLTGVEFSLPLMRLQCEREIRSLDIQIQRGILACRGQSWRVSRIENAAQDALVRILRGIVWLSGDRNHYLPLPLVARCSAIVDHPLPGCWNSIHHTGRHDMLTLEQLLEELELLAAWVDRA